MLHKLRLFPSGNKMPTPASDVFAKSDGTHARSPNVIGIEDRLFLRASHLTETGSMTNARVLLAGFSVECASKIRRDLRSLGVQATAVTSGVGQLPDAARMTGSWTHLFVNIDAFEDVSEAVGALVAFRNQAPEMVVIVGSGLVRGDDFGAERSAMCDVTLRLPVSLHRLHKGVVTASLAHRERTPAHDW